LSTKILSIAVEDVLVVGWGTVTLREQHRLVVCNLQLSQWLKELLVSEEELCSIQIVG
jgi:hypothetical protein